MDSWLRRTTLSIWLAWLSGCGGHETSWVLDVSGLESHSAEVGSTLEFSGQGFPTGQAGQAVLHGTLRSGGSTPRDVTLTLGAYAASDVRVNASIDERAGRSLPSHASFEGSAELRFASRDGTWVAGALRDVSLEWRGNEDANESGLRRDGERVLASVGLEVNESVDGGGSVRVSRVQGVSGAAGVGVLIGDQIEFANGVRIRSLSDLAQAPTANRMRLTLRDAVDRPRIVSISIEPSSNAAFEGVRYLLWACPIVLALLFLGPWPTPTDVLRRGLRFANTHRRVVFRAIAPATRSETLAWSGAAAAVSCIAAGWGRSVSLGAALAVYAVLLSWRALLADRRAPTGEPLASPAPALPTYAQQIGLFVILALALGSSAALGGSASLGLLGREQAAAPMGWSVFARPTTWLAGWIALACAAQLHACRPANRIEASVDNASRIVLAASMSALWLGGSSGPELESAPALTLGLGSAIFAVKTFGVLCCLAFLQPMAASGFRTLLRASAALGILTLAWLGFAPQRAFELRVGGVVLTSTALASCLAVLEYWMQRRAAAGGATTRADSPAGSS